VTEPTSVTRLRRTAPRPRAAARTRLLAQLRALQEAALALAAPVPAQPGAIAELLRQIVERAVRSLGAADGAIVLVDDPAWQDLVPGSAAAEGYITLRHTGELHRSRWRPEGTSVRVLTTGRTIAVTDTLAESEFGPYPALAERGIRSFYIVPLLAGGRVLGRIGLNFTEPGERPPEDVEAMELFAAHAAAALERVRLQHEQAERAAAEAAVRARDEFLSVAAHELKTPVTTLRGYSQFLLSLFEREGPVDRERFRRILRTLDQQADKLARLIDQLLDVSRLEAGKLALHKEPTDVGALVAEVVAAAQARTTQHRLILRRPEQPVVAAVDPLRFEQVVANLLDNAIKYSPRGGDIDVDLARPARDLIRLSVRDRGVGIPEEHRPHIFERFYQAPTGGPRPGMGLGLYITRQIVTLHGGSIAVESPPDGPSGRPGQGTRFVVTLPARE
jgi:signal transduction histidine kinase